MVKHYKNEKLIQFLVIIGAVVGLVVLILRVLGLPDYGYVDPLVALDAIIVYIIGFVVVVLTFVVGLKPNDPIPFHWLIFLILGILLIAFGAGIWACVLLIIAFLIALIEEL